MHILLVVVAVHPARNNTDLISSYFHYTTILNLTDIMLPIMLNQIRKFENLNNIFIDIFINVYLIEEQKEILPLFFIGSPTEKGATYQSLVQDSQR